MQTQLAHSISPIHPAQGKPVITPLFICPVRDRCLREILAKKPDYRCGFELAGSVMACPKRRRLEP